MAISRRHREPKQNENTRYRWRKRSRPCSRVVAFKSFHRKAVQLLKGNSSKWIHEIFPKLRGFEWQEGYGAFSISVSGIDATVAYIRNQAEHHRTRSFRQEFIAMLRKHGLKYDESLL